MESRNNNKGNVIEKLLQFPQEIFTVILSNDSFLDIPRLDIETYEDAHIFVKNYGYDMDNAIHSDEVFNILTEAKRFIQSYLLEDPEGKYPPLVIPPHILLEDDIRNLIVMASNKERDLTQRWACAILRVAHTITHVENDLAKYFFSGIKKQIFERFMKHLSVTTKGEYTLGHGSSVIHLKLFETKHEKTKDSLVMKLLHKKENVTADIFDRVGIRIVTKDKLDVLLVLKYFLENHVISFANVKPSRTRNTLINIKGFFEGIEELKKRTDEEWDETRIRQFLLPFLDFSPEELEKLREVRKEDYNPYSSTAYTSLQMTIRQMITVKDPFNKEIVYKFFFPFELQILDYDSWLASRVGRASHEEYKHNQLIAVRHRVLWNVINYYKRYIWKEES